MKKINLPNIYGYGQIFAFSALDGKTSFKRDFTGTLTNEPIGIRFELSLPRTLSINAEITKYNTITSDIIDIDTARGNLFISYYDCHTVVGYSPYMPALIARHKIVKSKNNISTSSTLKDSVAMAVKKVGDLYLFAISYSSSRRQAKRIASNCLDVDIMALKRRRYDFYNNLPKIQLDVDKEKLYYKSISILKSAMYAPEGMIPHIWTTPDRVPHRNMWLWDSVFHALGIVNFDHDIAENAIMAVLSQMKSDGFVPHMMTPYNSSKITQPPILAWGVWEIYKVTKNVDFLKACSLRLAKYLEWDKNNRDVNNNGLLEWQLERDKNCKCGECGMDNSPRFDSSKLMDAIDFSSFYANDCECLALILDELNQDSTKWKREFNVVRKQINQLLWCKEDGIYYDREVNGDLLKVASSASFLPLFAGVADKEKADLLVKTLLDKNRFWTSLPVPSTSIDYKDHSTDMWRGSVWLNYNYLIIKGLRRYGYNDIADTIKNKTINSALKWYKQTGCIYEFYDCNDTLTPTSLMRKGVIQSNPDWRVHMHSISDYGWSAAVILDLLSN